MTGPVARRSLWARQSGQALVESTVAVLLPPGTQEDTLVALMEDLVQAARELGVTLVGGHTEVTEAVRWPVLTVTGYSSRWAAHSPHNVAA